MMSQTQFLLLLIAAIPLFNCGIIATFANKSALINVASKFFPILFFATLIGLYGGIGHNNDFTILKTANNFAFGFSLNQITLYFLFLLNFLWLILVFYSHRFLRLSNAKYLDNFKLFFALFIMIINWIIIACNLLSLLFFYSCLIFLCHFFALKFFYKNDDKFSRFLSSIFFLQIILLFLAILITYKFSNQIDFSSTGFIAPDLAISKAAILLSTYFIALFLPFILPFYLIYREFKIDLIFIYPLFFLGLGLVSLGIFIKILSSVFGFKIFVLALQGQGLFFCQLFFLSILVIVTAFLVFAKTIKTSFFYLLLQQLIFTLFAIVIFAYFNADKIYLPLIALTLNMTLIFMTMSNLLLYLNKAENKTLSGLFYDLKVTVFFLFFATLSLFGFAPSVSMIEKFFLLKIIFTKNLTIAKIILAVNFFGLIVFIKRLLYPLLSAAEDKKSVLDLALAKKIDSDSALILTSLLVVISLVLSLIFFGF